MPWHVERRAGSAQAAPDLEEFPDTRRFLEVLQQLEGPAPEGGEPADCAAARGLFASSGGDIFVARAPGRLDVYGGIADYSGALVLQMPLAEACHAAAQRQPAAAGAPPRLTVVSLNPQGADRAPRFEIDLADLAPGGEPLSYPEARALLRRQPSLSWAAYVAGALVVLAQTQGTRFEDGLSILVSSDVPEGKGVSSSAAVEVASMAAVAAAYGLQLEGRTLALLCQQVENHVVGAPCGVMDQMTSVLGERSSLLALRCQPAEVQGSVAIPDHLQFWGVDSGKRHCVSGSDYAHVRVGAFMGLRMSSELAHQASRSSNGGSGNGEAAPVGGGYLANVPPSDFAWRYEQQLPKALSGAAFLGQYGTHWDTATSVDPEQMYAVRTPAAHPVHENHRAHVLRQVLAAPASREQLEVVGELMRQSHVSYGRCGLGSEGTDRLADLVEEERAAAAARGEEPALFGAKITGGGGGGTVGVLSMSGQRGRDAVQRVVQRYAQETGHSPKVFHGSSSGAAAFGHLRLRRSA